MTERTHQAISHSIRNRITSGEWAPGAVMPGEIELADEYGCARTTVNRALRTLADDGLIERKRRAGTRVREIPIRKAKLEIQVIRLEIESSGVPYRPHLLLRQTARAPAHIAARLNLQSGEEALHLQTVHLADGRAYAYEDRWVNIHAAPDIIDAPFDEISANEWLVRQIPYSDCDIEFAACNADASIAQILNIAEGDALFTLERTTRHNNELITTVKIYYPPGYKLRSGL